MSSICHTNGDTFVPVTIDENDVRNGIYAVMTVLRPNWPLENLDLKIFTDGITNKLVACQLNTIDFCEDNIVLIRIYGNKTDLLIDRNAEIRNIKTLNVLGLAPKIYGVFENGLAYQYYPGNPLSTETVVHEKIWSMVSKQMAKMHQVELGPEISKEPMVWNKIEQFLSLLPETFNTDEKQKRFVNSFGSITKLRIEFEHLKLHLTKSESPIVFAHNDLLLGNIIYNQNRETVSFIDYEYANYNYQAFDIANHFNEFVGISIEDIDYSRYPNKELQTAWITTYLTEFANGVSPSEDEIERVIMDVQQHSLASHLLWGIWSLVQFEHSKIDFDFGRYAEIRINRYFELKSKIYKERPLFL